METRKPDIHVPREIWENRELTIAERCIFAQIHYLDNPKTHCYASNEYFAEYFQISERTISRAIAHLIELGYVSQLSFNGRSRVLKSNIVTALENETGLKKIISNEDSQAVETDMTKCLPSHDKMSIEDRQNVYSPLTKCLSKEYIENNKREEIKKNKEYTTTKNPIGFSSSGTENAFGNKYDSLVSKKKNKSYHEIIEEYTSNPDFRNLLEEYYEVWKEVGLEHGKRPLPNVFKGFLRQLDRDGKDEDERIEIVEYCMAARRHYSLPYIEMKERQSNSKKFSQQKSNISKGFNQSMTNEELEEYRKQQEEWRNEMEQKGIQIKF